MKTDVDHLPAEQRGELDLVQDVLMEEFADAIANATSATRKNGKILKIILFGSYARNDWVDEPENGYQSDFDLLVIVNHDDLTDVAHYWYVAEDRILRDRAVARPVNIIVHSIDEVNRALKRGEYFWVDIAREGIVLYELPCHPLAPPMPLTATDAYEMVVAYFQEWLGKIQDAIEIAEFCVQTSKLKDAAFNMHQATERAYVCFLLVRTLYFPRSHNIKFLRSLAEDSEPRLIEAWPRGTRIARRRFELLKRAYVEARYSTAYEISVGELMAILASVRRLRDLVEQLCRERIGSSRGCRPVASGACSRSRPTPRRYEPQPACESPTISSAQLETSLATSGLPTTAWMLSRGSPRPMLRRTPAPRKDSRSRYRDRICGTFPVDCREASPRRAPTLAASTESLSCCAPPCTIFPASLPDRRPHARGRSYGTAPFWSQPHAA